MMHFTANFSGSRRENQGGSRNRRNEQTEAEQVTYFSLAGLIGTDMPSGLIHLGRSMGWTHIHSVCPRRSPSNSSLQSTYIHMGCQAKHFWLQYHHASAMLRDIPMLGKRRVVDIEDLNRYAQQIISRVPLLISHADAMLL